uniref:HTH_Tnp_Tc3_2 domain-containing protein n=1 Tax=Caenorhabditis japonica TaxID=281687 RepID=A0A8R1DQM3_CAEJA
MVRPFGKKTFTVDVRKSIVRGHELGAHPKILATQFGCSSSQIYRILKNNRDDDGVVHRHSPGRPRTTSRGMDRNILRACREDPRHTSTDIQVSVTSPNEPVPSRKTIRRRLQVAGLHGRRPVKKPFHLSWGPREWANHIWSDELKFNMFGTDGIQWIRRPIGSRYAPQYQCPTVKHGGGSVMVWGCCSDTFMGPLKRIVGTMDRYVFEDILENTMRKQIWADRGCFSRIMTRSILRVMSPIGFDVAVWMSWNGQTLLDSMPRRCQAVIDAKGYPTKY